MIKGMKFVTVDGVKHIAGDSECTIGWCGAQDYPRPCKCGGLIHAEFGDENQEGDYWLYEKCDRCGKMSSLHNTQNTDSLKEEIKVVKSYCYCGKPLEFRGFCSVKCHNDFYDSTEDFK